MEVIKVARSSPKNYGYALARYWLVGRAVQELDARLIDTGVNGNGLYRVPGNDIDGPPWYFLLAYIPSDDYPVLRYVPPEIGENGDADLAYFYGLRDENGSPLTTDEYLDLWERDVRIAHRVHLLKTILYE